MHFSRVFLNRLPATLPVADTVVVIDVLRSFTTSAVALARGACAVFPVEDLASARKLCAAMPGAVSVGAIAGGDPAPGFDFGNSPAALMNASLSGRPVVMSTAAGVRGLHVFRSAPRLYAASLVCARATAEAITQCGARDVCCVVTGEWLDRDGDEDVACADYIEALLHGGGLNSDGYSRRVTDSDFGRRYGSAAYPTLARGDLEIAARADSFPRAMPVSEVGGVLVIR